MGNRREPTQDVYEEDPEDEEYQEGEEEEEPEKEGEEQEVAPPVEAVTVSEEDEALFSAELARLSESTPRQRAKPTGRSTPRSKTKGPTATA